MNTPWLSSNVASPPKLDRTSPVPIDSAPPMTVQRTPTRSASQPIAMPPAAEPNQASAKASEGTERGLPSSAAICFSATTVMYGAPNDTV